MNWRGVVAGICLGLGLEYILIGTVLLGDEKLGFIFIIVGTLLIAIAVGLLA